MLLPGRRRYRLALGCATVALALLTAGRAAAEEANPYAPAENLSRDELGQFLKTMQAKPQSIRNRPNFSEALVLAADRILVGGPQDDLATTAILVRFRALHTLSLADNAEASERLVTLSEPLVRDKREEVAQAAELYLLERRVLDSDKLEVEALPALLVELKNFYSRATLDNRHVRMASGTVGIINRLKDEAAAAAAYREFGSLFAKSADPELARYGRKIEKGPKNTPAGAEAKPLDARPKKAGGASSFSRSSGFSGG
jgi:hypothetical protein